MQKITAIIPTFNEEANIEAAIQSVAFADEILIVDSFSTDRTLEIAKKYTDFILQREFDSFARQKNWAIPQARHEWILLIDADERITPELQKEIREVLKAPRDDYAAFAIFRRNFFMGKEMHYGGLNTDKVKRLFKRDLCKYNDKHVHETLIVEGEVGTLTEKLNHFTYTGFDDFVAKKNRYAAWSAKDHLKKTPHPGFYHFMVKPVWRFFWQYVVRLGFMDGIPGLVYAYMGAYGVFTRYVKIWLMQRNRN